MQVDCQDFLSTSLMQIFSTNWNKSANIRCEIKSDLMELDNKLAVHIKIFIFLLTRTIQATHRSFHYGFTKEHSKAFGGLWLL